MTAGSAARARVADERIRRANVRYSAVRVVLFTIAIAVLALQRYQVWTARQVFYALAGCMALMLLFVVGLERAGGSRRFTWLQLLGDTAMISLLVALTGGIASPLMPLYFFNILAAATLLPRHGAVAIAGVNAAVVAAAGLASTLGAEHPPALGGEDLPRLLDVYARVLLYVFGFFLVAVLADQLAENLRAAGLRLAREVELSRALRRELAQVVQSIRSGLAIVGPDGRVRAANEQAFRLVPALREAPAWQAIPGWPEPSETLWEAVVAGEAGPRDLVITRSVLDDGGWVLILDDVTSLREMERQLQREERYTAVGQLAAAFAHEVRNPLAALSGAAQMLRPAAGEERLHAILRREVRRLEELVQRFVESARPTTVRPEPVDLAGLVEEVVEGFRQDPRYREDIAISTDLQPVGEVMVDPVRIRQILWNLLLNAAQAMPEGGAIRVGLARAGNRLRLVVSDDGVGIPPQDQPRVFDPFYTTRQGGTGLGLAVVERVVREHGGQVWLQSRPGQGTTLVIWLPDRPSGEAAARA